MSYTPQKHSVFSDRVKIAFRAIADVVNKEGEEIDDIYINETTSGAHADFIDNGNATAVEHTNAITALRAFQTTYATQLSNITPFLQ